MKFLSVAKVFESIEQKSGRLEIMKLVSDAFSSADASEVAELVYLLQGKLGPDFSGIKIGMGERFVEQSIAKVSGFPVSEINAVYKKLGDLGLVGQEVLKKRKQQAFFSQELGLKKVFDNMLKIARAEGTGSQESKIKLLAELLNSASPLEAKFIVRIPLEELRLGLGDPTIMDAMALVFVADFPKDFSRQAKEIESELKVNKDKKPEEWIEERDRRFRMRIREMIEEKYNVYPDLGKISEKLKENGLAGLAAIEIVPGIPIRPTAAERLPSAAEIIEKLGKCAVEAKYDGFRLQCHKSGDKVTIFSRNSENVTAMFPEVVDAIKSQIIAKAAIFEAEAIAFNVKTGEFFPFQVTIQRKRKYGVSEKSTEYPLRLFCFDLMFLEGKNLMPLPFVERRAELSKIIASGERISLTKSIITEKVEDLEKFFDESVSQGLEGIIAKDLNAPYIAGARKFAWIKLKRSYKGELSDTVDVVIVGYFVGQGKRTQFGLGGLLSAVYNPDKDRFETLAKIGTGMTEQMLSDLESTLSKLKVKTRPKNVESNLEPDFWVEPKLVAEVRADEITKSPVHTAGVVQKDDEGFALRFPRLIRLRIDKAPKDATTVKEIISMYKNQKSTQVEENGV
ncbi:MAG: ATP-dependent DNA ligase [Candidatus Diapherotrites archaeon]|uniref:DNA ligase n=1 Tax=Candidatus Iainarchaeum sp. TaxID=3101447 RepID=A0A8T4L558_9ARCH|nr:ATP-dependent DNA ligase [Candidatus Diapherotrites archaeon]